VGQITEDMIDGSCCALCGQYFEHPKDAEAIYVHEYPVACWDCYEKDCGYQKAEVKTF
jgi:hypothetical protein